MHDLSKYSPSEFIPGAKYFVGYRSPNDLQRQAEGYSTAWLHHKGRNLHHFEYWTDYQIDESGRPDVRPVRMPVKYVAEMFADRIAACKTYKKDEYTIDDPLAYFMRGKHRANYMHADTEALLEHLLTKLSTDGEDATCKYIKTRVLKEGYDILK